MRTFLRLMGTSDDAADRALGVIARITDTDLRDFAFGALALAVVVIDISLIAVIAGGGQ